MRASRQKRYKRWERKKWERRNGGLRGFSKFSRSYQPTCLSTSVHMQVMVRR